MAGQPITTPFYEGAPLDPSKLNDLRTDIINTYGDIVLTNKTVNGFSESLIIIYDCGRVNIPKLTAANKPEYVSITFQNSSFKTDDIGTYPIIVTATVSTDFTPAVSVSSLVKYSGDKKGFQVGAVASGAMKESVTIDWIAIQKIPKP